MTTETHIRSNIRTLEGQLSAVGVNIALVAARFNSFITERLVEGAIDCILRHGGTPDALTVVRVPGSWEIPLAVQRLARAGVTDGVVALGAVIRGATAHFDFVAAEVSKGIAAVSLETGVPVTFGVLTTDTLDQAVERAGAKAGNKGWEAAQSLLEMIGLVRILDTHEAV